MNYYNFINCTSAKKLGLLIDLPEHKVQVLLPITSFKEKYSEIKKYDSKILQNSINGWDFILDTLGDPTTIEYIIKLNGILAKDQALEVGKLRSGSGGYVVGSDYSPPISNENDVRDLVEKYLISSTNLMHDVLEYFCYATKSHI